MRDIKFFASYYAAIKELPDSKQGMVYKAVFDYAMEGVMPDNLSGMPKAIFDLIKPYLDSSKKQYENGCAEFLQIVRSDNTSVNFYRKI